jgi:hypothetical protein
VYGYPADVIASLVTAYPEALQKPTRVRDHDGAHPALHTADEAACGSARIANLAVDAARHPCQYFLLCPLQWRVIRLTVAAFRALVPPRKAC